MGHELSLEAGAELWWVIAWSTTMVWVPDVDGQLFVADPFAVISRSSDRGYPVLLVVAPLTAARNRIALQLEVVVNQGVLVYVFRAGCVISTGDPELVGVGS